MRNVRRHGRRAIDMFLEEPYKPGREMTSGTVYRYETMITTVPDTFPPDTFPALKQGGVGSGLSNYLFLVDFPVGSAPSGSLNVISRLNVAITSPTFSDGISGTLGSPGTSSLALSAGW